MTRRAILVAGLSLILVGILVGAGMPMVKPPQQLGDPLPGLTPGELARFTQGKAVFSREFTASTGLGDQQVVHLYSDLLLHDMGPALADLCKGVADRAEFRTEPLMGLRAREWFLHDGRALTLESAIIQHGG